MAEKNPEEQEVIIEEEDELIEEETPKKQEKKKIDIADEASRWVEDNKHGIFFSLALLFLILFFAVLFGLFDTKEVTYEEELQKKIELAKKEQENKKNKEVEKLKKIVLVPCKAIVLARNHNLKQSHL